MTSLQVFKTQSVEPDALIAPFFQLALKFYKDMNMAVARWTANQGGRLIRKSALSQLTLSLQLT